MSNKASAAKPKIGGAIYVAPIGTELPTDAVTPLDGAFEGLGYISDAGIVNSNTLSSQAVKAWGGDEILNISQGRTDNFRYTLLEVLSEIVLKEAYGDDNVTGTLAAGIKVEVKSNIELPEKVYVVEMVMKDGVLKRIVIPSARVTAVGDVTYSDSNAVGYETTINAVPDSEGNTHYEYIKAKANG